MSATPPASKSPPSSPFPDYHNDIPVIATNDFGMIVEGVAKPSGRRKKQQDVKVLRTKSKPRQYVSKHFSQAKSSSKRKLAERQKVKSEDIDVVQGDDISLTPSSDGETQTQTQTYTHDTIQPSSQQPPSLSPPLPSPPPQAQPRIIHGLNIDELSSDSELSSVPSDIDTQPDPFLQRRPKHKTTTTKPKTKTKRNPTKSPYFPNTTHAHRSHFLTTLPFPPLSDPRFGLMQERLAHDPFRLLIATIFLNKTPGSRAMPIFFQLMQKYPTPLALSEAEVSDVTNIIHVLGFQNQRARKCVAMAKAWVTCPPSSDRRFRKLNYPCKGDGRDIKEGESVGADDGRVAWEISHLPGLGPYSHDSWRMFCRDELRGLARDWLGNRDRYQPSNSHSHPDSNSNSGENNFEPEWKRVLPLDKELRAWMTWMWLKEGYMWNKETGEKTKADEELLRLARDGGVVQERTGDDCLVVKGLKQESILDRAAVEPPAGEFIPG